MKKVNLHVLRPSARLKERAEKPKETPHQLDILPANDEELPAVSNQQPEAVSPPAADNLTRFRLLSEADKTDLEVNQILIRRLMRALLVDEKKAA